MPAVTIKSTPFLRLALLGDAAAGTLAPLLGLAGPLLRGAGLVLLSYAAVIAWAGTRAAPLRWAVRAAVAQWTALRRAGAPLVLA